ncbi:carbon-nitrogen hydrolase family protein [Salarchaeum sp. JOR-1]|uniref:carbon-nitrogen hydrolase family protein n=1 Tax=Salarchaeum sp. JOR-1 TaxID=2599399 RepID=UPI001198873F|nr:carbon-nitrogen hydrolase family protein [Salarchaeum sp. JOR-1]QDX41009.1 carbon-nitrogen hydrolase family protein [Salarchaeum sp. JOR-1]
MVTVAACQLALSDLDPDANLAAITDRLRGLPDDTRVAVFPEYALTGFVADDRIESVALDRESDRLARLDALAREHDTAILAGFVEDASDAYYNTAVYVTPEGDRTYYRKRHLWADEADALAPGDERVVVDSPLGRTGLVTCYDLNFVAESAAFTGDRVDALFVVGAWPAPYAQNWNLLLRARALDGVRWVVGAGRTGRRDLPDAPVTDYAGQSRVIRPDGSVQAALNRRETDLVADIDPDDIAAHREFIPVV